MEYEEELIRKFSGALFGLLDADAIRLITGKLSSIIANYNVSPKTTELSIPDYGPPCSVLEYLGAKKVEGLSSGSLAQYSLVLKQFYTDVHLPPERITATVIRAWLCQYECSHRTRRGTRVSAHTMANKRTILHGYFEWGANAGFFGKNPCRSVASIRYEKPERRPLTDEQMEQLRYGLTSSKEQALTEVLYSSGCRVSELCRLDICDVDFRTRAVRLYGKGRKHRTSYISARAVVALKRYLMDRTDSNPALFVWSKAPHQRYSPAGVERIIAALGFRTQIYHLHPHLLRHTMATNAANNGMPIQEISALLGHESVETTMIYAHTAQAAIYNSYSRCVG